MRGSLRQSSGIKMEKKRRGLRRRKGIRGKGDCRREGIKVSRGTLCKGRSLINKH